MSSVLVHSTESKPPTVPVVIQPAPYGYAVCRNCGYERAVGSGPCGLPCV